MTFQNSLAQPGAGGLRAAAYLATVAQDALSIYQHASEIYGQGEPAGPLYAIEFGCVRIGRFTVDGRRQVCGFCFAGDVFGWESDDEHHFFAEAIGDTGVRVLRPNRDLEASAKLFPLALQTLVRFQEHLLVLGRTSVDERLAAFLCDLIERQGDPKHIKLPMQRSDIGDYLGVSFETISRVLRRFRDQKLISVPDTHSVEILDLGGVQYLCGR
jgi:CRP/FNR family nitrogen fixation transcriptional regulator